MKILSYSLFCFILCYFGLCDKEQPICTRFSDGNTGFKDITCAVYANIQDTGGGTNCEEGYTIEFFKHHCEGNYDGNVMTYNYFGCNEVEGVFYVNKVGADYYTIDLTSPFDAINMELKNANGTSLFASVYVSGYNIEDLTDKGKLKGIVVEFKIPDNTVTVRGTLD